MNETAHAKINLALHVRRRRHDGYHEIETVFAFVDTGDRLSAAAGQDEDRLSIAGEFAGDLSPFGDNLLAQVLSKFPRESGWHVTLEKNLPVAAGLGGGSADAGALIRMIGNANGWRDDWEQRAASLGADVPACVVSRTCLGTGTGTDLTVLDSDLAGTPVLLVNPRKPLSTGSVFKAWDGIDREPLPAGTPREIALAGRNDLEMAATALCPAVGMVLGALKGTSPWLARMAGSGASCFALYDSVEARDAALETIAARNRDWWTMTGLLV